MKGHTDAVQDITFDHTGKLLGLFNAIILMKLKLVYSLKHDTIKACSTNGIVVVFSKLSIVVF